MLKVVDQSKLLCQTWVHTSYVMHRSLRRSSDPRQSSSLALSTNEIRWTVHSKAARQWRAHPPRLWGGKRQCFVHSFGSVGSSSIQDQEPSHPGGSDIARGIRRYAADFCSPTPQHSCNNYQQFEFNSGYLAACSLVNSMQNLCFNKIADMGSQK